MQPSEFTQPRILRSQKIYDFGKSLSDIEWKAISGALKENGISYEFGYNQTTKNTMFKFQNEEDVEKCDALYQRIMMQTALEESPQEISEEESPFESTTAAIDISTFEWRNATTLESLSKRAAAPGEDPSVVEQASNAMNPNDAPSPEEQQQEAAAASDAVGNAIQNGPEAVQAVINAGGIPDSNDVDQAVAMGNPATVSIILQAGGQPSSQTFTIAIQSGNLDIVQALLQGGISLPQESLDIAIQTNNVAIVQALIQAGAQPTAETTNIATRVGNPEITGLLQQNQMIQQTDELATQPNDTTPNEVAGITEEGALDEDRAAKDNSWSKYSKIEDLLN